MSVFGPREARVRAQTLHDRAAIHVEATIAPFSGSDRRRRGRGDKCVLPFIFVKDLNDRCVCVCDKARAGARGDDQGDV